jgi:membrane protease YdiL (CAAX protease family)
MTALAVLADQAVAADQAAAFDPQLALILAAVAAPAWIFVAGRLLGHRQPLEYEGRLPVPWNGIDVVAICALSFVLQALIPLAGLRLQGFELPQGGKLPDGSEMAVLIGKAIAGVGSFAFGAVWLVVRAGAGREALGWTLGRWRHDLTAGLIAATFIIPPVLAVQSVVTSIMPSEHPLIKLIKENRDLLSVVSVLAVFVAPLFEEFLFRVVLQGWLEKAEQTLRRKNRGMLQFPRGVWPILLSSIVFAAAHFNHGADPLPLFLFSLVLGYLYHQTHRFWPSLLLHMALNGLTASLLWIMTSK